MNTDKILIFFVLVAMLFWNPASFYLFYGDTTVYGSVIVKLAIWALNIAGLLIILLIRNGFWNDSFRNVIFTISFSAALIGSIAMLNFIAGLFLSPESTGDEGLHSLKKEGLIFEPNTSAHYKTVEFDFEANINSLGLRDREVAVDKGDHFRILCFGDSWTFGWGVCVDKSWPKQLESFLQNKGFDNAEVINCGQGGQYTGTYKKYMEKAVPLLKPDLVLVGVLQLDDLSQLYEYNYPLPEVVKSNAGSSEPHIWMRVMLAIKLFLNSSVKNIVTLLSDLMKPHALEVKPNWETSVSEIIASFNHLQRIKFSSLDDSLQNMFITGNLNPALLNRYINYPERNSIFNNPAHKSTRFAIVEMHKDVQYMKGICSSNNIALVFINLPINAFTGHAVVRNPMDAFNEYFEENNHIDSIYQSIAKDNGLPYICLTGHFINLSDKEMYYFKYDGHPNEHGYAEIAKYIGNQLIHQKIITIN